MATSAGTLFAFVASWTDGPTGTGSNGGVRVFRVDESTGSLSFLSAVAPEVNAGYLVISNSGRVLHVCDVRKDLVKSGGGGSVLSYSIAPRDGSLSLLSVVSTLGPNPSYIAIDESDSTVIVANHGRTHDVVVHLDVRRINLQSGLPRTELLFDDGVVTLFHTRPDGGLQEAADVAVLDPIPGPDPINQRTSHPHSARFDRTGRFALVCDKGSDAIYVFGISKGSPARLERIARYDSRPGVAPRHSTFHPTLPIAYVVNEQESSIDVLGLDERNGGLRLLQTVATAPSSVSDVNRPSEIMIHPTGRFLYSANRGHDSIAAFAVDGATGLLSELGTTPSGGRRPRGFAVEPDGRFMLVANTDSDCITTLTIDQKTGRLSETGTSIGVSRPACIGFQRL